MLSALVTVVELKMRKVPNLASEAIPHCAQILHLVLLSHHSDYFDDNGDYS